MHTMFVVDAFADRPFSGNPAAVCLLDREADSRWLQAVAAEMNLSETAFLLRNGADRWQLRWFTPKVEVDLCGHATLASAHVLWRELGERRDTLAFVTRSGVLSAQRDDENIVLDFPADPPRAVEVPAGLADALGVTPETVSRGRDDLLVVLPDAESVRRLAPDLRLLESIDTRGVIVTATSNDPGYDFVSRFFAPRAGIPEDPVTGSAHCLLGPYWAERLDKTELRGYQASPRGGSVGVGINGQRIRLIGRAVTMLKGRLDA